MQRLVKRLNEVYRNEPALFLMDDKPQGFQWIDFRDSENTVWSFLRKAPVASGSHDLLVVVNATPVVRQGYRIGVPSSGWYEALLNTDCVEFGGSDAVSNSGVIAEEIPSHGRAHSISIDLPPLATLILKVPMKE